VSLFIKLTAIHYITNVKRIRSDKTFWPLAARFWLSCSTRRDMKCHGGHGGAPPQECVLYPAVHHRRGSPRLARSDYVVGDPAQAGPPLLMRMGGMSSDEQPELEGGLSLLEQSLYTLPQEAVISPRRRLACGALRASGPTTIRQLLSGLSFWCGQGRGAPTCSRRASGPT
jgi:hypothetical protein